MKKLQSNKGFTLVELIIVIAILAIIMLIAIPNFSGIQQRMQVRADKATAAQIGKAVRVWYTDYTTDAALKATITDGSEADKFLNDGKVVVYSGLEGLDAYCSKEYKPSSFLDDNKKALDDQAYFVGLVTDDNGASYICVMIGTTTADTGITPVLPTTAGKVSEDYDGVYSSSDPKTIAYVEPGATVKTASGSGS